MPWSLLLLPLLAQTPEPPPVPTELTAPEPPPVPAPSADDIAVLKIGGYTIMTLRGPDSTVRAGRAVERFQSIVSQAPKPQLNVQLRGNNGGAVILVNGRGLIDVSPADAVPNGTRRVLPIAQVWASRLKAVLTNPRVLRDLFVTSGLPERVSYEGSEYERGKDAVRDVGRFTTDGARTTAPDGRSHVLYYDSQLPLPQGTIYLLNRFREFIPYARLSATGQ